MKKSRKNVVEGLLRLNNPNNKIVRLSCHADSRYPNDYNLELARRRCKAVSDALESSGIDATKIVQVVAGESEPKVSESPEPLARMALNRRVEIYFETLPLVLTYNS